ncbi:hypothetical protein M404DRAFT_20344 [Pisolithus tinctorius Marx 270]|uniref:Uncharacterized protein n=1 Tax=Pisolithus tinctorius Marx 270 TaxID=870435 RepID=A0A0C3JRC7_PISTI|nr:hypothetical protein M404DRAFT_20344 [Pisolithus tinctorius Marx 270]
MRLEKRSMELEPDADVTQRHTSSMIYWPPSTSELVPHAQEQIPSDDLSLDFHYKAVLVSTQLLHRRFYACLPGVAPPDPASYPLLRMHRGWPCTCCPRFRSVDALHMHAPFYILCLIYGQVRRTELLR